MIDDLAKKYLHSDLREIRETMLWKLDGLGEYDIRRPLTLTGTNLLGLVKHLSLSESRYFGEVFDRPFPEPLPRWDDTSKRGATQPSGKPGMRRLSEPRKQLSHRKNTAHSLNTAIPPAISYLLHVMKHWSRWDVARRRWGHAGCSPAAFSDTRPATPSTPPRRPRQDRGRATRVDLHRSGGCTLRNGQAYPRPEQKVRRQRDRQRVRHRCVPGATTHRSDRHQWTNRPACVVPMGGQRILDYHRHLGEDETQWDERFTHYVYDNPAGITWLRLRPDSLTAKDLSYKA